MNDPRYAPSPSPLTLLVIDDERGLRELLSHAFTRRGWLVRTAPDGEGGIAAARGEDFDAVVCDIMMSGTDGHAVLKILRRERPRTPVVLVTGYPTDEGSAQAARLGAHAYLAKPYDMSNLCSLLDEVAALKRGPRVTS